MNDDKKNDQIISSHSILIGLTPIIPIPFADDLAKAYFQQRMVRKLAQNYQQNLTNEDLKALTAEQHSGCLPGCLSSILLYPIKKLFRKIFFFLEWKRAIDMVSLSYHKGYLLNHSLKENLFQTFTAKQIHDAIEATCKEVGTNPIEKAVKSTFELSKEAVKDVAQVLLENVSRITGQPSDEDLQKAAQNVESAEINTGVTSQLEQALVSVPPDYFQHLTERFSLHLKFSKN